MNINDSLKQLRATQASMREELMTLASKWLSDEILQVIEMYLKEKGIHAEYQWFDNHIILPHPINMKIQNHNGEIILTDTYRHRKMRRPLLKIPIEDPNLFEKIHTHIRPQLEIRKQIR